jgi:hypothetical protein
MGISFEARTHATTCSRATGKFPVTPGPGLTARTLWPAPHHGASIDTSSMSNTSMPSGAPAGAVLP